MVDGTVLRATVKQMLAIKMYIHDSVEGYRMIIKIYLAFYGFKNIASIWFEKDCFTGNEILIFKFVEFNAENRSYFLEFNNS